MTLEMNPKLLEDVEQACGKDNVMCIFAVTKHGDLLFLKRSDLNVEEEPASTTEDDHIIQVEFGRGSPNGDPPPPPPKKRRRIRLLDI